MLSIFLKNKRALYRLDLNENTSKHPGKSTNTVDWLFFAYRLAPFWCSVYFRWLPVTNSQYLMCKPYVTHSTNVVDIVFVFYWQVMDARHVKTAKEMFDAVCKHLRFATNGGNIR